MWHVNKIANNLIIKVRYLEMKKYDQLLYLIRLHKLKRKYHAKILNILMRTISFLHVILTKRYVMEDYRIKNNSKEEEYT